MKMNRINPRARQPKFVTESSYARPFHKPSFERQTIQSSKPPSRAYPAKNPRDVSTKEDARGVGAVVRARNVPSSWSDRVEGEERLVPFLSANSRPTFPSARVSAVTRLAAPFSGDVINHNGTRILGNGGPTGSRGTGNELEEGEGGRNDRAR